MESNRYPRADDRSNVNLWGAYWKPFVPSFRIKNKNTPTRKQVNAAVEEYLKDGGTITRLAPIDDPGEFARARGDSDFLENYKDLPANVF